MDGSGPGKHFWIILASGLSMLVAATAAISFFVLRSKRKAEARVYQVRFSASFVMILRLHTKYNDILFLHITVAAATETTASLFIVAAD